MKTQDEIRARLDQTIESGDDFFGFRQGALVEALDYEHVKDLLKEGVGPDDWHTPDVATTARDYLSFAIGKAVDHRGISASRSIEKLTEWLWCLGDDDLAARFEAADYQQYGAPKLAVLAEAWNVEPTLDADDQAAWERMRQGLACGPNGCSAGCGVVGERVA